MAADCVGLDFKCIISRNTKDSCTNGLPSCRNGDSRRRKFEHGGSNTHRCSSFHFYSLVSTTMQAKQCQPVSDADKPSELMPVSRRASSIVTGPQRPHKHGTTFQIQLNVLLLHNTLKASIDSSIIESRLPVRQY